MGSILGAILSSILKMGLDYFTSWYKSRQAEADKWNLAATQAQMQSVLDGHALEVKMDQATSNITAPTTLSQLKIQFGVAACFMLLFLTGCWTEHITTNEYKPELRTPQPSPEMFKGPEQLTPREQAMALYIGQMQAEIKVYNEDARQHNIDNNYVPGIKSKQKAKEMKRQLQRSKDVPPKS
jgi:hypothetical protein